MQTVIVEIYVPATSMSYDFRLPSTGKIGDVIREIIRILENTQQNLLFDKNEPLLCNCDSGTILKHQLTVAEAQLQDGTRLMLM